MTRLLEDLRNRVPDAPERFWSLVHDEVKRLARASRRREGADPVLQTTMIVNEAYLRLMNGQHLGWRDRAHFQRAAAQAVRRVMVDEARCRKAEKRGGGKLSVDLDDEFLGRVADADHLIDLDAALARLHEGHERAAMVVELRFFGGLELAEIAAILGKSTRTVSDDLEFARTWLSRALRGYRTEA